MNQNILYEYSIKETIGKGTFSKVKLGINKSTGEKVAIKILEKRKIKTKTDQLRIERELNILKKINHINIVKIIQTKEDQNNIYIIMEFINYDLFLHIVNNKRLNEKESSLYYFQLIQGLEYIHSLNIVHRDLKPENLLITKKRILKIIDFGLSNYFLGDELMLTPCGSPSYTPPEMIKGYKYNGFAVDIWSTGIILFGMLCGYLPFEERDNKALFKKIIKCKVVYPKFLSLNAQNLLKKILVANPDKRITINEIKKHPFYLEGKEIFYKRYPDLIEKIENSPNNILINDNNSAPHNNYFNDCNNIKITTFSISDKKEKDEKDKSSSNFTKHDKNKKLGPNFDLLKKILRGSKINSSNEKENIINTDRGKIIDNGKINIEENEKNCHYSPNNKEISENKSHMAEYTGKNFLYKQKILNANIDKYNHNFEDEKNIDYLKNSYNNYSNYINAEINYNQKYNTKRNQKNNDFSFLNNSKGLYIKEKRYQHNNTEDDDKSINSVNNNNLYTHNYSYKFKKNNKTKHKNYYSINGKENWSRKYFDSFYDKSYNNSSRIKSYIINKSKNDNLKSEKKSNSIDNRKIKKTKSPISPKYSGLSKKIISINNLYNSLQNKFENHKELPQERINKFDKNENIQNNLQNQTSLENIDKNKSIKNCGVKKFKKNNIKSEEHRKKKVSKVINNSNIKFSPSYLQKRLKSLKHSNNNSNNNIRNSNNNTSTKNCIEPIININNNISKSQKFKNLKRKEDLNKNHKRKNNNDKYNIKEIIKRRGLDKKNNK